MNATPARTRKARKAMAEAESYIHELVCHLRGDGLLDHHPEIAALADEAQAHMKALREARIGL
jgi:hypothetical protein